LAGLGFQRPSLISSLKGSSDPLYRFRISVYGVHLDIHLSRSLFPDTGDPIEPGPDERASDCQKNRRWNVTCHGLHCLGSGASAD